MVASDGSTICTKPGVGLGESGAFLRNAAVQGATIAMHLKRLTKPELLQNKKSGYTCMHASARCGKQQNCVTLCYLSKSSCACAIKPFCQASSSSASKLHELAECLMCQADAVTKVWSSAGSPVLQALSISTPGTSWLPLLDALSAWQ